MTTKRRLDRPGIVLWLAIAALSSVLLVWLFPNVFVLAPQDWQINRSEAIDLALERARDLGEPVEDPYIVAWMESDEYQEIRLLEHAGREPVPTTSRLARGLHQWRVRIYEPGAPHQEWTYEVIMALDGTLLGLRRGVPFDYENARTIPLREARLRAANFLQEQGLKLDNYDSPVERSVDRPLRTDVYLRYRDREAAVDDALQYGSEVRFAGDELAGFVAYDEDPEVRELEALIRPGQLFQTFWIFVIFLIIPPLAVVFVRRYHRGIVGVERGTQVFMIIFVASVLALLMTSRAATEANSFGNLTRVQNNWVWIAMQVVVYYPALSLLGFMSWSVGESFAQGEWRNKLASFDAIFRRKFNNATVADSSLRGFVCGLLMAVAVLSIAFLLRKMGVLAPYSMLLGPWWENARFPGLALILTTLAFTLPYGLFGTIFLVPALSRRLGRVGAGFAATFMLGLAQFAPIVLLPVQTGIPVWILATGIQIFLFLRFDLLTSLMAPFVMGVSVQSAAMISSADRFTELQGWLALAIAGLPLWLSMRSLGSAVEFQYAYDDIPPHVRRIAERERQRVEIETARRIQNSILPELPPQICGVEVAHTYLPASEVGGDFYDVLALEDGRLSIAIGDVAGHGVSSGLVMSMARSALAVQVTFRPDVEEVFETLNRVIYQSARKRLLTTLCYAVLDPRTRLIRYASAGHLYPYRVSVDGEVRPLESVAYPLGVRASLVIQQRETSLDQGDSLFLSSDGLVEARRQGGDELFGFDRLEESLARHAHRGARGILDGVLEDHDLFVGGGRPPDPDLYVRDDDLTVLVLTLPR